MSYRIVSTVALLLAWAFGLAEVHAQMFGPRRLGDPVSSAGTSGLEGVGTLTGNERYLRGNRRRLDFIGTDTRDRLGFVGVQQTTRARTVTPPLTGFKPRKSTNVNRTVRRSPGPKTKIYRPRLQVGFAFTPTASTALEATLVQQLERSRVVEPLGPIEVLMEGRTAILRGVVASERGAEIAGIFALLEPGVSEVRNELRVAPPPSDSAR
ncbi:MAG: hypothetical protein BMS9Abin04_222 [Planctomycetia bacterium]|nr:MAG: hypothetical protein BMS9Abin04_222 [Planctomycetia bacterium]